MKQRLICGGLAALLLGTTAAYAASEDDFLKPVGLPPKAKPQMRQGGEALPPLPLPATPLRRSEKKRPPSPSTLIGKVIWGSYLDYTWENGMITRVFDWNMVPADCQSLLRACYQHLNMDYKVEATPLDGFNATPAEIPVLYFSGGRSLNFSDTERETLRRYLLSGGMVWFDSVVGSPFFYKSALTELSRMLPEAQIRRLPEDHPLFHMVDDTVKLSIKSKQEMFPVLDAVYIGSRVAAIVSPYGLGAGWDNTAPELIKQADYYDSPSALRLGLNLVAYAMGYFRVGQSHAKAQLYSDEDAQANADPVVFAHIRTSGVWNTEPGGANNLLRFMKKNLSVKAAYLTRTVKLDTDPLADYSFLYLSGISDFHFDEAEARALRGYLAGGGFLIIDNSLGLDEFGRAVYREMKKVFPSTDFAKMPTEHALFTQGPFTLDRVRYTLAARAKYPALAAPVLECIQIDGQARVLYSPFDMAAGWQGDDHPLAYGYETGDALRLGANLITYCLTH
ncbi:MAG: DUF4159 domain-containing protein [Kiritimatiellia bacterium]|jgi:hypothetical protein|nr:DUF4159 domain-containing protein [Kiritimatiellia bacterium]MDD4173348.1 DUF4159 domain-containing protein [Kiritimatiellia bacterium]MDD4440851.1 DUF4159 domain-containing protein [Kiritimatiellia bacterium]NLC81814.1 DUF4159 domain-containing protein [Lentisphaerota bacterium]